MITPGSRIGAAGENFLGRAKKGALFSSGSPYPYVAPEAKPHNETQMSMTREELMAHLDAQQARTEAMLARQNAETEGRLARFEARIEQAVDQMKIDRADQKEETRSTKVAVVSTVFGSSLAILLALFGAVYAINSMNSSIVGNVISGFESGRNIGQTQSVTPPPIPQQPASAPK